MEEINLITDSTIYLEQCKIQQFKQIDSAGDLTLVHTDAIELGNFVNPIINGIFKNVKGNIFLCALPANFQLVNCIFTEITTDLSAASTLFSSSLYKVPKELFSLDNGTTFSLRYYDEYGSTITTNANS
jgi:hypothetical protein